jgi:hypothetical protein
MNNICNLTLEVNNHSCKVNNINIIIKLSHHLKLPCITMSEGSEQAITHI